MDRSSSSTIAYGRPLQPGYSPLQRDGIHLDPNDAEPAYLPVADHATTPNKTSAPPPVDLDQDEDPQPTDADTVTPDTAKSCDRLRPEEEERLRPRDSMTNMSSLLIGKTVTPFLREHIPSLYAPIGKPNNEETARAKNPNTRYCYRHRPDSKCRRAADEAKMIMIQNELDKLTPAVCPDLFLSLSILKLRLMVGRYDGHPNTDEKGIGSTSHHPRVVSVLCGPCPPSRAHAARCLVTALLPPAFPHLERGQRGPQDRLHHRPPRRAIPENFVLPRHRQPHQGCSSQPAMAPTSRFGCCLGLHVRATREQEMHQVRLGSTSPGAQTIAQLYQTTPNGQGQFEWQNRGDP